jgi:molybdate transport system substrate-binding protein
LEADVIPENCKRLAMSIKKRLVVWIGIVNLIAMFPGRAAATNVIVLCTNGIKPLMEDIKTQFEQQTNNRMLVIYGVAATLEREIESGEPFDIAILTPPSIDLLSEQKRIVTPATVVARSLITIAVRTGSQKPDIHTVEALRRTLDDSHSIAYASGSACAAFFTELCRRLGLNDALKIKSTLTKTGSEVASLVAQGEAELGILPTSDILAFQSIEALAQFPAELQGFVVMIAGVSVTAPHPDVAGELLKFLKTPSALTLIRAKAMDSGD